MLARHGDPPAISLITSELADDDLHALHIRGDCFVSLCRSEGWGLGAFDAAAYGNPVVTTGHGGHLEYLPDSAYLVDFELVAVEDPAGFPSYAPEQRWADPDVDHGAALLRDVLANREDAAAMAASLAEDLRWRYREQAVAAAFVSAVDSTREVARGGEAVEPRSRGRS
jgi:glycosyltransferase involved in cell wall biosynthesis